MRHARAIDFGHKKIARRMTAALPHRRRTNETVAGDNTSPSAVMLRHLSCFETGLAYAFPKAVGIEGQRQQRASQLARDMANNIAHQPPCG